MRKSIVLSVVTALLLLTGNIPTLIHAQGPAPDLKPTFLSPIPGLYVNGWPPFTVSYPKEWVAEPPVAGEVYRGGGTRPDLPPGVHLPFLTVAVLANPLPLEDWAKIIWPAIQRTGTNVEVVSDATARLKDGAFARELEIEFDPTYAPALGSLTGSPRLKVFYLLAKRGNAWVMVSVWDHKARFDGNLKEYVSSLSFLPGREEPVDVPPDVRAFLDMYCADLASHDVASIMAHYSDQFRHSGTQKGFWEGAMRKTRDSMPVQFAATVTVFESYGDRAYIDGFFLVRGKDEAALRQAPMVWQQIIKDQGQWKWYGNQK